MSMRQILTFVATAWLSGLSLGLAVALTFGDAWSWWT